MPTKRKSGTPEMLSRNVEIKSSSLTARISAVHNKGNEPEIESQPWLELKGVLTEPVKNVRDVVISVYPKDTIKIGTARPASCGAIIRARPEFQLVITWPQHEFDRLWSMVLGNRLTHAHFYFTKPHYNRGLVVNASFSSELEE